MQPVVQRQDDQIVVAFTEEAVGFVFDEFRRGGEQARVAVHHLGLDGQVDGRIQRFDLKLDGLRAHDEYVRRLDTIADAIGHDWRKLVDRACDAAVDAWRQGEPAYWLDVSRRIAPVRFAIDRVLIEGKVNIWFGAGGIGKGYLLVLAAMCITNGLPFLGLRTEAGRVMYLDWEDEDEDLTRRIQEVSAGLSIQPRSVLYRKHRRPLRHIVDGVVTQVRSEAVTTLVVDSCTGAGGEMDGEHGYEQIAQQLMAAAERITATGCTVLLNDHTSGTGRKGNDLAGRPYGSVRKIDLARAAWELKREEAEIGGPTRLGMFHQKHNHTARFAPIGAAFHHTAAGVRFETFDVRESETLAVATSPLSRMEHALRAGPLDIKTWATTLDLKEHTVYQAAKRHPDRFVCLDPGGPKQPSTWGLLSLT
jgi:hypothetical protein